MRTILEIPDELVRKLELRAAHDGRTPEAVAVEVLAAGLAPEVVAASGELVPKNLPLIKAPRADPANVKYLSGQAWIDWLKEVDLQQEVERYEKAFGHQHVDRISG